jgi:hypothetical protein
MQEEKKEAQKVERFTKVATQLVFKTAKITFPRQKERRRKTLGMNPQDWNL